jgi:hypothetical protein
VLCFSTSLTLWPSDSESVVSSLERSPPALHALPLDPTAFGPSPRSCVSSWKGVSVALRKDSHHKLETANVDYVHLVVGTDTRRICALFLDRLRMTVDKCVSAGSPHYFPISQYLISCTRQSSTPYQNLENYSCAVWGRSWTYKLSPSYSQVRLVACTSANPSSLPLRAPSHVSLTPESFQRTYINTLFFSIRICHLITPGFKVH